MRGVCILFVVLIHAGSPLEPGPYRDHVIGGLARLGVPLFLVISGFLAALHRTTQARYAQYFRRFLRLHVLYAVFYWFVTALRTGSLAHFTVKRLVLQFGEAAYPGQYYFLILIQLYLLAGFLVPAGWWSRGGFVVSTGILALAVTAAQQLLLAPVLDAAPPRQVIGLVFSQSHVGLWLYYFALGAWLGERHRRGTDSAAGFPAAALVLAGLAVATWSLPLLPFEDVDLQIFSYRRPSIYIAATLVALALPALARLRGPRTLARIGAESLGIFVFNPAMLFLLFACFGDPAGAAASLLDFALAATLALLLAIALRPRAPWLFE